MSKYQQLKETLHRMSRKHGWGCILVTPEQFKNFLLQYKPRKHLDVGCHNMLLEGFIRKHVANCEYVGLDIVIYKRKIHVIASGCRLPFRDKSIDTISFIETLEHIPNYVRALREAKRVARKAVFIQSVVCNDPCALADETHYHVLHPRTLARLMSFIGFKNIKYGIKVATFWLQAES